jgi:lipid II:glycine glycyltransferase (peptidoglycan interpeptide bridge formation enzyme)
LLEKIVGAYGKSIKYMEIRSGLSHCNGTACYDYFQRHVLTLSKDTKKIWDGINKRTIQYSIRRATKAEVSIHEENTFKGLLEFYRLNMLTRAKHGMPAQPKKYFLNLYENMVLKNHASILLAYDGDRVIAAAIFFKFNETIIYKYNASDPEFIKKKNPNHLMTWTAIQNACENGYRFFDFGRTSPDNKGLMRYKEMWGAEKKCCHYHYHPQIMGLTSIQEDSRKYKLLTKMWKTMPSSLSEMISARLYRHMA